MLGHAYIILTSTLVSHWTISEVAALGDGDGNLRLDSSAFGSVGKHDST